MISKSPCPKCKGNKVVHITDASGRPKNVRCPDCSGTGYVIKVTNATR